MSLITGNISRGILQHLPCLTLVVTGLLLSACGVTVERDSAPSKPVDVSNIPDAVPKEEPRSRYGNPESYEVFGKRYYVLKTSRGFVDRGIASWYGTKFHGRRTSSGETYDMYAMTAAHKTLPLPTYVEVTNLENSRKIVVKVNDRGPFHDNRIIDLSYSAATKLGIVAKGTGLVEVRAIDPSSYNGGEVIQVKNIPKQETGLPQFYIQIGAFSEMVNAENTRQKAVSVGDNLVKISQTSADGRILYRVRIGPLASIEYADKIVGQLEQVGIYDHHIVLD